MKVRDKLTLLNIDCMEYMKQVPDNYFDLAIVDPPYGINFGKFNRTNKASDGTRYKANKYKNSNWDEGIPNDEYFSELMRISKNQIVWGGNYFPYLWQNGCKSFVFWYKGNPVPNFSDGELAWTSFDKLCKQFDYRYYGNLEGNSSASDKIHPTQKPVALYDWIYKNYTQEGCKVIDTHLGSGSNAVAAHYSDKVSEFVGCELDKYYYKLMIKRVTKDTQQLKLF